MTQKPREHARSDANRSHGRRAFLGAAAGVLGVGATAAGTARAQDDPITVDTALPSDAPRFGNSDYLGLFVHVAGVNQNASTENVACPFAEGDDAVVAYDVTLIDRASEDTPQADSLMFAPIDTAVEHGKLFIITNQQSCEGDQVQIALEQVGAAEFPEAVNTSTPTVVGAETTTGTTTTTGPGFGVGAALTGLLGAGELLRRRE